MDIKDKIRSLPSVPGVYLMKDSQDTIIYVGKSKNLKSRVGSYFYNSKSHSPKVVKLVKNISDFEYIITDTEFEAFILECKLIKELKPHYNKKMKSPLSYVFVKVSTAENSSGIEVVNELEAGAGSVFFGPYAGRHTVETAIQGIKECCKILCGGSKGRKSGACLNFSLGSCIGICMDNEDVKYEYKTLLAKIINLLSGKDKSIIRDMEAAMNAAVEKLDFESASKYRDYIGAVNYLLNREQAIGFANENNIIAILEYLGSDSFKFFLVKRNEIIFSKKYSVDSLGLGPLKTELSRIILFYSEDIKTEIAMDIQKEEIDELQIVYSYITASSNNCRHAVIPVKLQSQELSGIIDYLLG